MKEVLIMTIELKKTICTESIDELENKIKLGSVNFIVLVLNDNVNEVLKCYKNGTSSSYLFILKQGFCLYTKAYKNKDFDSFYNAQKKAESAGFKNLKEFKDANAHGINNGKDYYQFRANEFYDVHYNNKKNAYKEFCEFREGGFESRDEYKDAQRYEIPSKDIYDEFKESNFRSYERFQKAKEGGFTNPDDYKEAQKCDIIEYEELMNFRESDYYEDDYFSNNEANYQEYKKNISVQELGFRDLEEYEKAMELGIIDSKEYILFLASGCETSEEFEIYKQLPELIETRMKDIEDNLESSDDAYLINRYEEFTRYRFLVLLKISKLVYLKLFRQEIEDLDENDLLEIIKKIEEETSVEIVDEENLEKWGNIYENIMDGAIKIEAELASEGKAFFNEAYSILKDIIECFEKK